MFQVRAKIVYNKRVKDNYFRLAFQAPRIIKPARPGQFVSIKVNDSGEPLLRRPFSIHRLSGSSIEILYEVVGRGTEILSESKVGEYLDVIGPLGSGFYYQLPITLPGRQAGNYQLPILVAGGMGVAPLIFLAEKLTKSKIVVLIGAKTKNQILCENEFKKLGCAVKIATDDGSRGFKGYVSELLKKELTAYNLALTAIYSCGPRPMLQEITALAKKYNIPAQLSLEEHLACGIGACLGCAVNTAEGYQRICREGPVFNAEEVIW